MKHLLRARSRAVPMAPGGAHTVFGAVVTAGDRPVMKLSI